MNDKVKYWLDLASDDLDTAKLLCKKKKLLFSSFLCHLVIEKGMKAAVASTGTSPPKSHDLVKLAKLAGVYTLMNDEQKDLLDTLSPLNIEARYPSYKNNITKSLDKATLKAIIKETEALLRWTEKQL